MAITKILGKNHRVDVLINYAINKDKTDEQVLTDYINCDPGFAYQQMMDTKRAVGKTDGRQCYHIIQSFVPGEVTPELAFQIAQEFAKEHLKGYQVVIGTHVDRDHIHSHIVFNSVNMDTGEKYNSTLQNYYRQIRATSDRLCRVHGLSVIMQGENSKGKSYIEWLRNSRGQHTYRTMLKADLDVAIEDANDIGHFLILMENQGYEIKYGNRLGFRLPGQAHFMYPERKDGRYSEEGIRSAIAGNLLEITAGRKPAVVYRPPYRPYKKHPKYKGFLALYVHYLYVLGKMQKQQYPPRITPELKKDIMRFEQLQEQFKFLQAHGIETESQMKTVQAGLESKLTDLTKRRTILNVRKKKHQPLYKALADAEALLPIKELYEDGITGMEEEYRKYQHAVDLLNHCGIFKKVLTQQKAEIYTQVADLNREIRQIRKDIAMCQAIQGERPKIEKHIQSIDPERNEVNAHEHQQR